MVESFCNGVFLATCAAIQSGKSSIIRESDQASGIRKEHYALYYVQKSSILFAGTGESKIRYVATLVIVLAWFL